MVLDNATVLSDADFTDNEGPASDVDKYSSSNSSAPRAYVLAQPPPDQILIPYDQLSQVKSFFSLRSQKETQELVAGVIRKRCEAAANILGRPVRQDEAEAFAVSTAHAVRISNYGSPVGITLGTVNFWRTYMVCSFPGGWTPGKAKDSRFSLDRFGRFKDGAARRLWQFSRLGAHLGVWAFASQIFFASYGFSVLMVRSAGDPRLKDYNEALRLKAKEAKAPIRSQDTAGTTQNETFDQRRQRANVQQIAQARRPAQQQYDDASPTGGSFQSQYSSFDIQSELLSDAETAQRDQQAWPSKGPSAEQAASQVSSSQRRRPTENALDTVSQTADMSEKASESAWDRLRQQALGEKSGPRSTEPKK